MKKYTSKVLIIVKTIAISLLSSLFVFFMLRYIATSSYINSIKLEQEGEVHLFSSSINGELSHVVEDLLFIKKILKDSSSISYENQYVNLLTYVMDENPYYDQLRVISSEGMELIRINNSDNGAMIVEESKLQDKSGRYYFDNAIVLSENSVYFSLFDLNIENKEIEIRNGNPVGMVRIATPFIINEEKYILIINYNTENLFHLADLNVSSKFEVINSDNYFIHSFNNFEYGFMYDEENIDSQFKFDTNVFDKEPFAQFEKEGYQYTSLIIKASDLTKTFYSSLNDEINFVIEDEMLAIVSKYKVVPFGDNPILKVLAEGTTLILFILISIISFYAFKSREDKSKYVEKLEYLSSHDTLTGLYNRTMLLNYLQVLYHDKETYTLFYLDIDRFKRVNDLYGHNVGDKVIIGVANQVKKKLRKSDVMARIGGDEFVFVIKDLIEENEIVRKIKEVQKSVEKPLELDDLDIKMDVSIGYSIQDGSKTVEKLIAESDMRMYEDKKGKER